METEIVKCRVLEGDEEFLTWIEIELDWTGLDQIGHFCSRHSCLL